MKSFCLYGFTLLCFIAVSAVLHIGLWYLFKCDAKQPVEVETATPPNEAEVYNLGDLAETEALKTLVNEINQQNYPWKARLYAKLNFNFPSEALVAEADVSATIKQEYNQWTDPHFIQSSIEYMKHLDSQDIHIPDHFDARLKWPSCTSLHNVKNQGSCGSCWAEAATSVIADRMCIASNGYIDVELSTQDMVECCEDCNGCHGGHQIFSFNHWLKNGVVTGGKYQSNEGCKPFKFDNGCGSPCSLTDYIMNPERGRGANCIRDCRLGYYRSYQQDKYFGAGVYTIGQTSKINTVSDILEGYMEVVNRSNPEDLAYFQHMLDNETLERKVPKFNYSVETIHTRIKKELLTNGPVSVCFPVPKMLVLYNTGVFCPAEHDDIVYNHCVKIIGWGVEQYQTKVTVGNLFSDTQVPYWLITNSWGRDWGERGFFKVLRSSEAFLDIYNNVLVGIPSLL